MPPAARVTDMHTCPMFTGPVPHVGGPILPPGAPTVLVGFLPAARVTDMLVCVGPPDMIAKGSAGVFINYLPAARMGDITAHGGVIVLGMPTVMIGEIGAPSPGAGGAGGVMAGLAMAGLLTPIAPNASVYGEPGSGGGTGGAKGPVTKKSSKGGSTTVTVDDANKTVTIKTSMEFCGPDATEAYAAAAKKQIEDTWSGTMQRNGETYKVNVDVTTSVSTKCTGSKTADQIIVDSKTNRMSQTLYGAGPGYQTPGAATDTARPRRIAHEYGHTLGLDDDYTDTPTGSVPKDQTRKNDIMSETWPDSNGVLPHPDQAHYDDVLKKHGF